jgi:hypothetical protein
MLNYIKNLFKRKPTAKSMQDSKELEWNPAFVMFLIANGYSGPTAEDIVDQWFTDMCRNVSMDGMADGSFIAEAGRMQTNSKTRNQA